MRNKILKAITAIMCILFYVCACALDSENFMVPVVGACVSAVWLGAFCVANGYMK